MKLASAVFYTNDLERIIDYYKNTIGLEVDYIQEGRFVSFNIGSGKLGIKKAKEKREIPGHQTVFIEVDDVEDKYSQLKSKGVNILKEVIEEDWATNFSILDPDGNKIQFIKYKK